MKRTQFFTLTQKVRILLLLCCMLAGAGQAWAVNNATWVNIADVDPSDGYTFVPSAGTVSDLSTIQVTTERDIVTASDYNSITHGYFEVDVVMPKLIRNGYADITAQEVTSTNQKPPFTITFQSPIPDGEYTLVIPEGTFYHLNGMDSGPIPEMRVNYTLQNQVSPGAWKVIITGAKRDDEQITYRNRKRFKTQEPSKLASNELEATVGDGEYFIFKDDITERDLLDCDFTSSAESRTEGTSFIYGPVIDWENHTITCEIREAITAKPTTAGWYQLKWDVSTNNSNPAQRYSDARETDSQKFTRNTRDANRFYITMPRGGNSGRDEYLNYNTYPTDDTTPLTFVKLVPSNNGNLMMMTIDGRFVNEDGTPSTSGSGHANSVAYVDGELDFQYWFPFGNNSTYFLGQAGGTHNYFYTAPAKFDDDRYEFYEVTFEADNVPSTAYARYKGSATNYSMTDVYQNGYFVFPKGHVPTVDDFDVSDVTFTNMTIDIKGTGNVKTLTFKELKATLDGTIKLKFVDNGGHDLTDAKLKFVPSEGDAVVLSSAQTTYEFHSANLSTCKFCSAGDYNLISYNYNDESKTLTFTLGVPEWYIINHNYNHANKYLSTDYVSNGHVAYGSTLPNNYAGFWKIQDITGEGLSFFNAKYNNSKILTVVGGNNALMDDVDNIRENAVYAVTKTNGNATGRFRFPTVSNPSKYLGMSSLQVEVRDVTTDGSVDLTLTHVPTMGKSVTVNVIDGSGTPYAPGAIFQTQCEDSAIPRDPVSLTNGTKVDFHNMPFLSSLFSVAEEGKIPNIEFDEENQVLTLKVIDDPNLLRFSPAPENGQWVEGTKWFTIHNNRNNKGYLSTQDSGQYLDDAGTLTIKNGADASGNRGGLWAFVPLDGGGFNIYNNAYGPDFILGITGSSGSARLNMYQKDAVPSGVSTLFTYGENSNRDGGASCAYYFRIGIEGTNHLNEQNGYAGTWAPTGEYANRCESDNGSAFTITAVNDEDIANLPTYDVYKVEWGIRNKDVNSITYGGSGVFGKRGTPSDGAYMIVEHGTVLTAANFTDGTTPSHTMANVSSREVSGHAYRLLVLDMKRPVRVTLPQTSYTMTMGASMEVPAFKVTDNAGESLLEGVTTTAHYTSDNASVVIDGISMRGVSAGSANISVTDFSFNALGTQYYYTDSSSFAGATATVTVNPGVMTVRFSEPNAMLVTDEDDTADVKQSGVVNFTGTDAITQLVIEPAAAATGARIKGVSASVDDKITIEGIGSGSVTLSSKSGVAADLTLTFTIASTGYNDAETTLNVRVLNNSNIVAAKRKRQEMADKPVGSGLGRYTYEGDSYDGKSGNEAYNAAYAKFTEYCNKMYSYSDADIVKYCAEISGFCTDLNSHLSLNMPVAGKTLLRAKGYSDNYISGAGTTGQAPMITNDTPANTILYYTAGGELIGYVNGLGFTGTHTYANVNDDKNTHTFSQYGTIETNPGKYYIKSNYDSRFLHDNNKTGKLDRCSSDTGDNAHAQHAWTLEDVTELPVTIGATGYATLCSPVALTVPYGVEAYVDVERKAPVNNISVIKLQKLNGVIPANTAVVLRGREGNYNFRVTTSSYDIAIEGAKNGGWTNNVVMQGTYPKLTADGSEYTLQNKSDATHFYPNTSAQLKPFRVFIPTEPGAAKVQMFMMDFGGDLSMVLDTTIDTSEPSAPAYDLSGRMMQPTHRGIYLQQGRKVLVH